VELTVLWAMSGVDKNTNLQGEAEQAIQDKVMAIIEARRWLVTCFISHVFSLFQAVVGRLILSLPC
jgi:hypothetical protein